MSYRVEGWRPEIENLKTNDTLHVIGGDVDCLAHGERLQIAPLFLNGPGSINGRMDPFRSNHSKDDGDSVSIRRASSSYSQQ